jgi:hypothetical protein
MINTSSHHVERKLFNWQLATFSEKEKKKGGFDAMGVVEGEKMFDQVPLYAREKMRKLPK